MRTMLILMVLVVMGVGAEETRETVTLDTLEVTASQARRDPVAVPTVEPAGLDIATSVVGREDLQRMRPVTVTDALELAPGSWTETRGRKVKQFTSFRGQQYPYPDYALDGLWFREFHELPYFFPAHELEQIEVIRSASALLKGNSGLAGVINLVPRRYDQRHTYAEVEGGEYGTVRATLSHHEPVGNGGIYASVGHYETDNHKDVGAERMENAALRVVQPLTEELELDANLFILNGERELVQADPPAGGRFQNDVERFDPVQVVLGSVRMRYRPDDDSTTELAVWGADRRAAYSRDVASNDGHQSHADDDYEYGAQLLQSMTLGEDNVLRVGGLYHRWVAPDGKRFFAGRRTDVHTLAAVVVDEHQAGRLTVDGGVRVAQEYIDEFGAFSIEGSGGAFRDVAAIREEWAEPLLRANLGCRFEATDWAALYANYAFGQVDPRDGSLTEADVSPDTEQRHTLDLGVRLAGGWVQVFQVGGFVSLRDGALLLSGETYMNAAALELEYYANRDVKQFGLEVECRSKPLWDHAVLFANALLMDSRIADASGQDWDYKEVPDRVAQAGLYINAGPVDISLFGKYVSDYENSRFAADQQPKPLGDYVDLDLVAGVTLGRDTRLYAKVENLLDKDYSTVVGYPDAGRHIKAGLQHTF